MTLARVSQTNSKKAASAKRGAKPKSPLVQPKANPWLGFGATSWQPLVTPQLTTSPTVQAKLKIGDPNDKYEQEADRVAAQVMRMPESQVQRRVESMEEEEPIQAKFEGLSIQRMTDEEDEMMQTKPLSGTIQRMTDEEEEMMQTKPVESTIQRMCSKCEEEEKLQRMEMEEEEETLQTTSETSQAATATPSLQNGISRLRQGGGATLPDSIRSFMEPRFGYDFSNVRIHTAPDAARVAHAINSRAFTLGQDVVFGVGQYQPNTTYGRRLLAHELTHVLQQKPSETKQLPGLKQPRTKYDTYGSVDKIHVSVVSDHVINRATASSSHKCTKLKSRDSDKLSRSIRDAKKLKRAKQKIEKLDVKTLPSSKLEKAFVKLFGPISSSDLVQTVKDNVGKITSKIDSITDILTCDPTHPNCVEGVLGFTNKDKKIGICPDFFEKDTSAEERTITLLHEVAHVELEDEPDIYVHNRLFDVLASLPGRPGTRNPDSLAIFIRVAARNIALDKELKDVQRPPKDKFKGFSSSKEKQFVRKVIMIADSIVNSANEEINSLFKDVDSFRKSIKSGPRTRRSSPLPLAVESMRTLVKLKESGLLINVKTSEVLSGEEKEVDKLFGSLAPIKSILNLLQARLKSSVNVKRSTDLLGLGHPGSKTTVNNGLTVEIHDVFFVPRAMARSGTEAEKPVITVKIWLSEAAKAVGTSLRGSKLEAFEVFLGSLAEDLYKKLEAS